MMTLSGGGGGGGRFIDQWFIYPANLTRWKIIADREGSYCDNDGISNWSKVKYKK